jgi:hypothetical protein
LKPGAFKLWVNRIHLVQPHRRDLPRSFGGGGGGVLLLPLRRALRFLLRRALGVVAQAEFERLILKPGFICKGKAR